MSGMIECEGLTKRFGTFTAVDHVTFSVGKGSIFGFLGPNGSGKSTVIRMLCGILEPTEGTGRIAGHDVVRQTESIKPIIGYMSQKFSLYDELTVNENLIFAGKLYSLSGRDLEKRRDEMIAMTHLEPYLDRRAALLSGGWRQRLAMACSLMHKPSVLFLDEPTAGIDPVARRELWDLLFDFAGKGMTLFVTTHYMDEAERCHRLAFIFGGELLDVGTPEEIVQRRQLRVAELDVPRAHDAAALLRDVAQVEEVLHYGQLLRVATRGGVDPVALARDVLGPRGVDVRSARETRPTVEDAFVAMVRAGGRVSETVT
jgi:ABC-2 type transport system ATP-binding protein